MGPLVFFGIVLIGAILIGVLFENFTLDVKSGRRRPLTPPPRRAPTKTGPGQTKIWRSQLMHADDKRPKPKPSKAMGISEPGSAQSPGAGQTQIWRSQKEYRPDGLPKPKPTQGMRPSTPGAAPASGAGQTKIWRSQKEYRPDGLSKSKLSQGVNPPEPTDKHSSVWGESSNGQSRFNLPRQDGSAQSAKSGRLPQSKVNPAGGRRTPNRRPSPADQQLPSPSRQPNSADRPIPPRAPQRGAHDRPIVRPGQPRYSDHQRTQSDPFRTYLPNNDPSFDTHLGDSNQGASSADRSIKRPSQNRQPRKPYSPDEPTRIQYTDRLRPIAQPRQQSSSSRSSNLNLGRDRASKHSSQSKQPPSERVQNHPNSTEPFNPADYEQTYIGPFLDEDAIAELNREVDSPPPDVVYQETHLQDTHLGPFLDDDVIEEIQEDEIEELRLEGDVQPFDSAYYDQTYIGSSASASSVDERTQIRWREDADDAPKWPNDSQPMNAEEDSTLLWRRPVEKPNDPRHPKDDRFKR